MHYIMVLKVRIFGVPVEVDTFCFSSVHKFHIFVYTMPLFRIIYLKSLNFLKSLYSAYCWKNFLNK